MRLIILNGPTGVGKSTVATRLHDKMPLSVLLHIDELRRAIPNYRENRAESLRIAYEEAAKLIEKNLRDGKDVIIDKTIADSEVLDTLINIARKHNVEPHEFLLLADKEVVQKRADDRGYIPGGLLTPEKVMGHWESADKLRSERQNAILLDTTNLSPDEVFNAVCAKIGSNIIC